MRVSCLFVTVAIMLAEQSNALPVLGLQSLDGLSQTVDGLPLAGPMVEELLDSGNGGISLNQLVSKNGLVSTSALDDMTSSLQTRQLNTASPVKRDSGLQSLPLVGSFPGMSQLASMPGLSSLPSMQSLPGAGMLSSLPVIGNLASAQGAQSSSSIPGMNALTSLPGMGALNSVPGMLNLPSMSNLPVVGQLTQNMPGLNTLAL